MYQVRFLAHPAVGTVLNEVIGTCQCDQGGGWCSKSRGQETPKESPIQ